VTVDQQKDRVYLPLDLLARHNYTVEELFAHKFDERFRAIMREAVDRARELFLAGLPLNRMVNRRLGIDLELFSRGGMRILDKIERRDYDVLSRRPKISKIERVNLLIGTLARMAFARAA
jgi:phytoene/squalene synthetase